MSAAGDPTVAHVRERALAYMVAGDRGGAIREAGRVLAGGMDLADFVLEVLAPVQAEVGRRWQAGSITTREERLATEIAEFLLTMAAGRSTPPADGARVALLVADRDHHNLPARMVAELLRLEGHRVTFLGTARPGRSLTTLLTKLAPDAVVLSCSLAMNLPGLVPLTETCDELGLPVVAGGRGFEGRPLRAQRLGIGAHAGTVAAVGGCIDAVDPQPVDPERRGQYDELRAAHRPLTDELAETYLWRAERLLPRALRDPVRLREYVSNLMRFTEAAVLCDEQILIPYRGWLTERFAALRADPAAAPLLLGTLRDRLAPDLPLAGAAASAALASA